MNFEDALKAMKEGRAVQDKGWGENTYIYAQFPDDDSINTLPYIVMQDERKTYPIDIPCIFLFSKDWKVCKKTLTHNLI